MRIPRKVAVVGGGVAGMATALGLADLGHRVRLLERRPFLGGRVYSFPDPDLGCGLDNGQHAMLGCYRETLALLARIGSLDRLHWQGLRMEMREAGRRGVLDAGRTPAPLHLTRALLGYRLLSRAEQLTAMTGAVRLLARWRRSPEKLAGHTVAELLADLGQTETVCRRLWNPIAIAALNADPAGACAALFAAVIDRAFFGHARDAAIVLPAAPLAKVFGEPGEVALRQAGVEISPSEPVVGIELDPGERTRGVRLRGGRVLEADAVVLAVPPRAFASLSIGGRPAATSLGGWVDRLREGVPIVSTHVPLDAPVALPEMLGLLGTTTQWVFHTDGFRTGESAPGAPSLLSCVTSDAAGFDGMADREVARTVAGELERLVPEVGRVDVERIRVVREKHATIAATVEATAVRPATVTGIPGLFLAGDWVRTGLPATIESAAASARLAVARVEEFEPLASPAASSGRAA